MSRFIRLFITFLSIVITITAQQQIDIPPASYAPIFQSAYTTQNAATSWDVTPSVSSSQAYRVILPIQTFFCRQSQTIRIRFVGYQNEVQLDEINLSLVKNPSQGMGGGGVMGGGPGGGPGGLGGDITSQLSGLLSSDVQAITFGDNQNRVTIPAGTSYVDSAPLNVPSLASATAVVITFKSSSRIPRLTRIANIPGVTSDPLSYIASGAAFPLISATSWVGNIGVTSSQAIHAVAAIYSPAADVQSCSEAVVLSPGLPDPYVYRGRSYPITILMYGSPIATYTIRQSTSEVTDGSGVTIYASTAADASSVTQRRSIPWLVPLNITSESDRDKTRIVKLTRPGTSGTNFDRDKTWYSTPFSIRSIVCATPPVAGNATARFSNPEGNFYPTNVQYVCNDGYVPISSTPLPTLQCDVNGVYPPLPSTARCRFSPSCPASMLFKSVYSTCNQAMISSAQSYPEGTVCSGASYCPPGMTLGTFTQTTCLPSGAWSTQIATCLDVDECQLPDPPCGQYVACQNTQGSYQCGPRVVPGSIALSSPVPRVVISSTPFFRGLNQTSISVPGPQADATNTNSTNKLPQPEPIITVKMKIATGNITQALCKQQPNMPPQAPTQTSLYLNAIQVGFSPSAPPPAHFPSDIPFPNYPCTNLVFLSGGSATSPLPANGFVDVQCTLPTRALGIGLQFVLLTSSSSTGAPKVTFPCNFVPTLPPKPSNTPVTQAPTAPPPQPTLAPTTPPKPTCTFVARCCLTSVDGLSTRHHSFTLSSSDVDAADLISLPRDQHLDAILDARIQEDLANTVAPDMEMEMEMEESSESSSRVHAVHSLLASSTSTSLSSLSITNPTISRKVQPTPSTVITTIPTATPITTTPTSAPVQASCTIAQRNCCANSLRIIRKHVMDLVTNQDTHEIQRLITRTIQRLVQRQQQQQQSTRKKEHVKDVAVPAGTWTDVQFSTVFYTSADIYSSISFPLPTIKSRSLRRYDLTPAPGGWFIPPGNDKTQEPLINNNINGEVVTFFGERLFGGSGHLHITFGSEAGEFTCEERGLPAPIPSTDITPQIIGPGTNISCLTEARASGQRHRFFVSIAGTTISGDDLYSYRDAPRVVAVQATTIGNDGVDPATSCQSTPDGTRTVNCPTSGNVFIIISIANYEEGTLLIQIAGSICIQASDVTFNPTTFNNDVLCLLPAGVGQNQPVSVSITTPTGILFGPANNSLSYAAPIIDQVVAFAAINLPGSSHSMAWYVNQTIGAVKNIVAAQIQRNDLVAQAIARGANQSEIDAIRVMPEPYGESQQLIGGCASSATSSSLSSVVVSGCPRNSSSSIIILRLAGRNFGGNNAQVFVGSSPCLSVLHVPGNEHSELLCALPNGKGLFLPLVVLQNNGLPSSSTRNSKGEIEIPSVSYAQCNPGTFDNVFEPSTLTCQPCPIGTYADAEGQISCTPCPPGSFTSSTSSRLCTLCGKGTYQDQFGASSCVPCANGTYAATEGQPRCSPCTRGTARSQPGGSFCDSCPAGTEQGAEGGTSCNPCDVGYANPNPGRPACEICPAGKFASSTGRITCDECPLGFYQSLPGKSFCSACEPGKFASQSARLQCTDCAAGTYSNIYGASQCTPCPIFSHQNSTGQTSCIACLPQLGQFTDKIGEAECTNCTRGLYRLPSGTCVPCPIGADCYNGLVLAQANYYLVQDPVTGIVTAHQCLPGYCEACNVAAEQQRIDALRLQFSLRVTADATVLVPTTTPPTQAPEATGRTNTNPNITSIPSYITSAALNDMYLTSVVSKCSSNREDAANNTLCGKCIQGHIEWGGKCIPCTATHWGLVTGLFFVAWCYVLLIHFLSQSASSDSKIFLYYAQMVLLFSAGTEHFSWVSVLQFNLLNTSATFCISPLSGMEKLLGGIVIPILCMGLLCLTAIIHFGINFATRKYIAPDRYTWLPRQVKWNYNPFIRTACALFLFSYNSITDTTLRYFNCKKVGDHTVVASQPSITCYQGDHARFAPLFWIFVAVVVCAAPLLMLFSLIMAHRRHLLQRPITLARFGIIYETYRDSRRPYWEFIIINRRVILITLTVVLSYSRVTMYSWLTFLNILFLLLHMVFLPYQTNIDNVLETISLVLLGLMTAFLCGTGSQLTPGEDLGLLLLVYVPGAAFLSTLIWLRYKRIRAAVANRGKQLQVPDKEMEEMNPVVETIARRGTNSHSDKAMKMMRPLPPHGVSMDQNTAIASPTVANTPHDAAGAGAGGSEIEMEGVSLQVVTSPMLPGQSGTSTSSPSPHLSDRVLHTNHPFTSHNSLAVLEPSHHSNGSHSIGGVGVGKWSRRVTEGPDEPVGDTPVAIAGLKFMS